MEEIFLERRGGIGWIVLNRPERRNALHLEMWRELRRLVSGAAADPDLRALCLRGAGGEAFAAGADIAEFPRVRWSATQAAAYGRVVEAALEEIDACPLPTVAAVEGYCVGGGLEIACACDLRVATAGSRFGVPVARIGVVVGLAEARRLARLIGVAATLDILYTARLIDAAEAQRLGLVQRVVPDGGLQTLLDDVLGRVVRGSPLTHRRHKQIARILGRPLPSGLTEAQAAALQYGSFDSDDFHEGVRSFLDKRPPRFSGREPEARRQTGPDADTGTGRGTARGRRPDDRTPRPPAEGRETAGPPPITPESEAR